MAWNINNRWTFGELFTCKLPASVEIVEDEVQFMEPSHADSFQMGCARSLARKRGQLTHTLVPGLKSMSKINMQVQSVCQGEALPLAKRVR